MDIPAVHKKFWQQVFLTDLKNLNPYRIGKYLPYLAPENLPVPVLSGHACKMSKCPAIQEEWDLSSIAWMSELPFFTNSHLSPTFLVSYYPQASNMLEHVSFIF